MALLLCSVNLSAHEYLRGDEEDEPSVDSTAIPKISLSKRSYASVDFGVKFSSIVKSELFNAEPVLGNITSTSRIMFALSGGGSLALWAPSESITISVAPSAMFSFFLPSSVTDPDGLPAVGDGAPIELAFPILATVTYRGLRKSKNPFGVGGGLGVTVLRSFYVNREFNIVPTAMVELIYAKRQVVKLRLISDIFTSEPIPGSSLRTFSIQLCAGF